MQSLKRRGQAVVAVAVLALAATAVASCSLVVSTDGLEGGGCAGCVDAAPPLDAASRDAAMTVSPDASDASTCVPAPDGGAPFCTCPGGIVYVASTGSDSNDGCSPASPKGTLQGAIDLVEATDVSQRVQVCKGTYTAPMTTVTLPVQIYGAYDCSTWTRTAQYGSPSFDAVNETILAAAPGGDAASITYEQTSVTRAAVLDGFTVTGATYESIVGDSYALLITTGASPTITNDKIVAASASVTRTVGIEVIAAGGPEIAHNLVSGGAGQRSIGISIEEAGAAFVHDNTVAGGSATLNGSYGLYVSQSGPLTGVNAVTNNVIDGGTGGGNGGKSATFGVYMSASDVDLVSNTVSSGIPACTVVTCGAHALFVTTASASHVLVQGNRLYTQPSSQGSIALGTNTTGDLRIFDNLLQQSSGATGSPAVQLDIGNGTVFADNTIYGEHLALLLGQQAHLSVDDNLLLGLPTATAVQADDCAGTAANGTTYTSFTDNALVGYDGPRLQETCTGATATSTLGAFESTLGAAASGNARIDRDCTGESSSAACGIEAACSSPGSACFTTVLTHWDATSSGVSDLLDPTQSWKLAATPPCLVSQLDPQRTAPVADDIGGTVRSSPFSAGAWESDALCSTLSK